MQKKSFEREKNISANNYVMRPILFACISPEPDRGVPVETLTFRMLFKFKKDLINQRVVDFFCL